MKNIWIIAVCLFSTLFAKDPLVIGIAGGTGAGKTTLAKKIAANLGAKVTLVSSDAYYKDLSHLTYSEKIIQNFDHPESIDFDLLAEHLDKLKKHQKIDCPIYCFVTKERGGSTVLEPKEVIIVEGILILADPKVREMIDVSVYVDASDDIRLLRRIERDIADRGYTIERARESYLKNVRPMHDLFVAPTKYEADVIISTEGRSSPQKATQLLTALIAGTLSQ